ncbi:ABC transporter substrate-binding protein [Blastococcus sp. BMG 814]|uniref:ABC transporter substrate-binding protein n=1 Tax=Blastococcus carthaginiensis TaxID=3050034 RepID=A0ABT9IBJ3_9ACTN|nr:ABC transporter substrate-binding protein [Blastococcus carthaginiensis]MDP5182500.1 ABC transporter substrate-binding protein [Blastococcus carthaginiensis]
MHSFHRSAVAAVAATALVALSACGGESADEGSGGGDASGPVVRLATGVDASYAPVYLAAEEGLFAEHGVNVEYVTTEGGPAAGQMVVAGAAEVATLSDATTTSLMATAEDLRAFAVFEQSDEYIKVVLRDGIESPADIRTMSNVPGLMRLATFRYLESEGVDPADVEFTDVAPPDIPTLLQRGDLDATVIFEPWATRAAEAGGEVVADIGDFDVSYSQWLLADADWLSENEEAAAGIAAAIAEANEMIETDPEAAAAVMESAVQVPADLAAEILPQIDFEVRDLTSEDVEAARETAQFFLDQGNIPSMPDLDEQLLVGWYGEHTD